MNREGPFLFDTSAESWLAREPAAWPWLRTYRSRFPLLISSITVLERLVCYGLAIDAAEPERARQLEAARSAYDTDPGRVVAVDLSTSLAAAEILRLIPAPPSPPKRSHRLHESRGDRLARWRFDAIIAATALVQALPLIHNNTEDFEAIRATIELRPERFPGLGPLDLLRCTRAAADRPGPAE